VVESAPPPGPDIEDRQDGNVVSRSTVVSRAARTIRVAAAAGSYHAGALAATCEPQQE